MDRAVRPRGVARIASSSPKPIGSVLSVGILAAVAVLFGMSGGMLWLLGYNYDGLSGSAVTKIHPFTYMVTMLFLGRMFTCGNPVAYVIGIVDRRPAAVLLAAVAVMMMLRTLLRQGPGMAGFIDSYVGPALLAILLADVGEGTMARLEALLHAMMAANAGLALVEFATKHLLFPYRFDGAVFATDLRSSALQGHPLANALLTACYILALLTGARRMSPALRLSIIALQGAALVAFGGRSAMVVVVLLGLFHTAGLALAALRRGRISILGAAVGVLLASLVPLLIAGAALGGFFDALYGRFISDGGSANARVEMLGIFDHLRLRDIVVGPDVSLVESLRRVNGLEWGIENPIIHMTLYQGAFLMLVVATALGLFLRELAARCQPGIWLPMTGCLILLNTSESIAVKTTMLAKFALLILCLYRPVASAAPVRTVMARRGQALRESPDRGLA